MHDFFDKLGATARRAAGNVANEVNVAAEKQRLSDAYRDLGKLCYQALKKGESPDFSAEEAKIDALLAKIAELKHRRNVNEVDTEHTVTVEPQAEPAAEAPAAQEPDFVIVEE